MIYTGSDFSGVGAFEEALKRLRIKHKTVFACDMDKYARQTYLLNHQKPEYFPENVYNRDIPVKPIDIYVSTPPCQSFSLAGSRKGENDKRGILFYNSHEFIKKNKPRYFILENVKGLLSDDKTNKKNKYGKTFQRWIKYLGGKSINGNINIFPEEESLPYHLYFKVLNSKNLGVPQSRERVFLVGIRDDKDNVFSFPKNKHLKKYFKDILQSNVDEKYFLSEKMLKGLKKEGSSFQGKFKPLDGSERYGFCVTTKAGQRVTDNFVRVVKFGRTEEAKRKRKLEYQRTGKDTDTFKDMQIVLSDQNYYDTILANPNHKKEGLVCLGESIRRLTPRECFRLMDFPDSFKWECSDTQAYKQAGNSIVVECLVQIISKLNLK